MLKTDEEREAERQKLLGRIWDEEESKKITNIVINDLAVALYREKYGNLERRICTAEAPMAEADKDKYRWSHPNAIYREPFFNLALYECPHCKLMFHAVPP